MRHPSAGNAPWCDSPSRRRPFVLLTRDTPPLISVVVATLCRMPLFERCLLSVLRQSPP